MKRVVASVVAFCLATGLLMATEPVVIIKASEIEAAAKAAVAEAASTETADDSANPASGMTGMSSGTWTVILLAALVVGAALYLISENQREHGQTLFKEQGTARRAAAPQYQHRFLRQQWQAR